MKKILTSIDNCMDCSHSIHFTMNGIDFSTVVCSKTRTVLLITDKNCIDRSKLPIPDNCPLPTLKTD